MPHHNPPQLTEVMRLVLVLIYGASKPLSARDIARRVTTDSDPEKARKALNYSLKKLEEAGHIVAVRENSKVVTYVKAGFEMPMYVLKEKGRKSTVSFKVRRVETQAADGSLFTMIDTGLLTNGVRHAQIEQPEVEGNDNHEQEGEAADA